MELAEGGNGVTTMVKTRPRSVRQLGAIAVVCSVLGVSGLAQLPVSADVTSVTGSAIGYQVAVSLGGGPTNVRGFNQVACTSPGPPATPPGCVPADQAAAAESPAVTLPPGGSATPITEVDADGASAGVGPAQLFESSRMEVSTQGTTGAGGSVSSSARVEFPLPLEDQVDPFNAESVETSCTASESDVSASTTLTNASIALSNDPDTGEPIETVDLPANPGVNLTYSGTVDSVGDSFRVVFNEQIVNPDGSVTVNGVHLTLLGPIATGDVIIAQSVCGIESDGNTATTTTTAPGGSTTTTAPSGSTTTTAPGGTTTTTLPDPGGDCVPAPGSLSGQILELAGVFDIPALQDALARVSQIVCQLEQRFSFGAGFSAGFGAQTSFPAG
ncbi:MAG TPA: hypothetical protein VNT56_04945 [Acidimicrobiales bacterium]|nr:hypothetical protein [Acidimicrobiales bacterium]